MGARDKQGGKGSEKLPCIVRNGIKLPISIEPYPELLDALGGMGYAEYRSAVGKLIKSGVIRIKV